MKQIISGTKTIAFFSMASVHLILSQLQYNQNNDANINQ